MLSLTEGQYFFLGCFVVLAGYAITQSILYFGFKRVSKDIDRVYALAKKDITGSFTVDMPKQIKAIAVDLANQGMKQLGVMGGQAIDSLFTKFKMSAMGALGGAGQQNKAMLKELGSVIKEDFIPLIAEHSGNPLLSILMQNERVQALVEKYPQALPLIQQHLMPLLSKSDGNAPQGAGPQGGSTYGR